MENHNNHQIHAQGQGQAEAVGRWSNSAEISSALSRTTMSRIRHHRPVVPGTTYTIHDQRSPVYGWLLPGWLAEERHMPAGRIYRVIVIILYFSYFCFVIASFYSKLSSWIPFLTLNPIAIFTL
jgi:hypothetical protein